MVRRLEGGPEAPSPDSGANFFLISGALSSRANPRQVYLARTTHFKCSIKKE